MGQESRKERTGDKGGKGKVLRITGDRTEEHRIKEKT